MHIRNIRVFEKACFQRGLLQFPHAPITVQNGRLLARSQNAMFRNENKAFQTMLRAVGAFFRFKQWTWVKRPVLEAMLSSRFILYGEWLYAKHSLHYRKLPHYFFD